MVQYQNTKVNISPQLDNNVHTKHVHTNPDIRVNYQKTDENIRVIRVSSYIFMEKVILKGPTNLIDLPRFRVQLIR